MIQDKNSRNSPGATMISCFFERILRKVRSFWKKKDRPCQLAQTLVIFLESTSWYMVKNFKLFLRSHKPDRIRIGRIRTFPFSFDFPHDSVAYMHVLVKTRLWESETEAKGEPDYNACSNALQKYWLTSSASACRLHSFTRLEDWRLRSCKWNQNAVLLDQNALYFWLVQWVDNTIHGINLYPVDNTIGFPITYPPGPGCSNVV